MNTLSLPSLQAEYAAVLARGLSLDMSRGKPATPQLDLSDGIQTPLTDFRDKTGFDVRNYGKPDGIEDIRDIFADLLDIPPGDILIGGSSSLNMMYDTVARHMSFGATPTSVPWSKMSGTPKFICPAPGYDRHFAICEAFGIEMVIVGIDDNGPDMDAVESAVADPNVVGMWIVPVYSNPTGCVYSEDTIRRLANLRPANGDFRILCDNAYAVHHLYDADSTPNLHGEAARAGNSEMVYTFFSTSKITYCGGGVAMVASGQGNVAYTRAITARQTICNDKVNQLRHARYLGSAERLREHMTRHADLLRPKFEAVLSVLEGQLAPHGIGKWTRPRGGYFISLDLPHGTAKRTHQLAAAAGVTLTPAGASFPYGVDPCDSNLRIAPSFPTVEENITAAEVLCLCAKIAFAEGHTD